MSKAKRIEEVEAAAGAIVDKGEKGVDKAIDNVVDLPRRTAAEHKETAVAFVKEHPGLAIAGGILAGVLVAALLPRRPRSKLGKRGAVLGDAVASTAALIARQAADRADLTGATLRRGSRRAAATTEDFSEVAVKRIGDFLTSLLGHAAELSEDAGERAEKIGKRAAKRLAKAGDSAEDVAVLAGRRIGKAASDARSRIIG